MHISLQKGDFVLVLPLTAKVGDAIVVRDPFRKERVHVRRLIALGPASVRYDKNGTITRDDKRITQKDMGILGEGRVIEEEEWDSNHENRKRYIFREQEPILLDYPLTHIQEGDMYVLADNRDSGLDSRYWGDLSQENILGVVCFRIGVSTPWFGWFTWWP